MHCFRDGSCVVKLTIYLVNQQREEASVVSQILSMQILIIMCFCLIFNLFNHNIYSN